MRCAVTGALSYTGRYLARDLLAAGHEVVNLSRRRAPIAVAPLTPPQAEALASGRRALPWGDVDGCARILEGCDVLFCSHWVRFAGADDPHAKAAADCARLFEAARRAGVGKVVLVSHTRTRPDSPFAYIRGKASAEAALRDAGVRYAVVRPCGVFGDSADESILLNNAAWVLRRSPLFLVPGDGEAVFQPAHVRDVAALMADVGLSPDSGEELDACGPDAVPARALFEALRDACGGVARVVPARGLSTRAITALTRPLDWLTGDTLLDDGELDILTAGLTRADDPGDPRIARRRSVLAWIRDAGRDLGATYASSRARYYYA